MSDIHFARPAGSRILVIALRRLRSLSLSRRRVFCFHRQAQPHAGPALAEARNGLGHALTRISTMMLIDKRGPL